MGLIASILMGLSLVALALAMDRHHRQVWQRLPSAFWRLSLKILGWLGLGLSCQLSMLDTGLALGLVQWFGGLSIWILVLALVLNYRPGCLAWFSLPQSAWRLLHSRFDRLRNTALGDS